MKEQQLGSVVFLDLCLCCFLCAAGTVPRCFSLPLSSLSVLQEPGEKGNRQRQAQNIASVEKTLLRLTRVTHISVTNKEQWRPPPPKKTVCLRRGSGTCRHCSYALWQQLMLSHHGGDTSGCHRPFHIPHSVCPSMSFHLLSGCCTFLCTSALYLPISLSNPCHILLRQRYGPCVTGCESDGCYRNSRLWPELCLHSLPVFTPFHTDTGNGLSHGSNASWKRRVRKGVWLDVCVWMCVFGRWWLRWTLNH